MVRGREGEERGSEGKMKGEKERRQMFHTGRWGRWAPSCSQIPSGKGLGEEKASLASFFVFMVFFTLIFPEILIHIHLEPRVWISKCWSMDNHQIGCTRNSWGVLKHISGPTLKYFN